MPYRGVTKREEMEIRDNLQHEQLELAKYEVYIDQLQDPALKNLFAQIRDTDRRHVEMLNQLAQRCGVKV